MTYGRSWLVTKCRLPLPIASHTYHEEEDDDDEEDNKEVDDDICIMMKCLSVCLCVTKNHHFISA